MKLGLRVLEQPRLQWTKRILGPVALTKEFEELFLSGKRRRLEGFSAHEMRERCARVRDRPCYDVRRYGLLIVAAHRGLREDRAGYVDALEEFGFPDARRMRHPPLLPSIAGLRVALLQRLPSDIAVEGNRGVYERLVEEFDGLEFAVMPCLFALLRDELSAASTGGELVQPGTDYDSTEGKQTANDSCIHLGIIALHRRVWETEL